jgi:glycosyltransferase involved in cell wall biosynthesis
MTASPLVSVLITAYNAEDYLAEAIESALAQSAQIEIVLVDDGSTDATLDVAARYPAVRSTRQDRGGIGAARNVAVSMATGDFLTFLDADDRFPAGKLEIQLGAFDADPSLEVVYGHVREFVSPDLTAAEGARIRPPVEYHESHLSGVMLIRRSAFDKVGAWKVGLKVGTGVEWYTRSCEQRLATVVLPDVLLERRLHLSNNGLQQADHRLQYAAIVKAALDRRRVQGGG